MANLMTETTDYPTLENQYANFMVPLCRIKVNGQDVVTNLNLTIAELTVTSSVKAAGYAIIKIGGCYDVKNTTFSKDVKDKFKLGTVVTIELGYLSSAECVFKGYVAMLGLEYSESTLLVVTLMDARRLMMTGGKKHLLHDVKNYSDAFSAVMQNYSKLCSTEVEATKDELENPISQTSSDYDFVTKELARKGQREFFIFGDKAYFRKFNANTTPVMTIQPGRELYELKIDHAYLDAKIKVLGYNHGEEEMVSAEKEVKSSLGQTNVVTTPEFTIVDSDADNQDKATNRAEFIAAQELRKACQGTGKTVGLPWIVPGRYVKIEKLDDLANKKFYVTEVTHSIIDGYFATEFEIGGMMS
ncbi:MAG: hypothetical protein IKL07_10105 [Clostridium sp.]|nr:hypothetical protein [Clostridium sp.]